MFKVLSIDFDYFVNVSSNVRNKMFPALVEARNKDIIDKEWKEKYKVYPMLKDIGLINEVEVLREYLFKNSKYAIFTMSENHKDIYPLLEKIPKNINIEIVNVDFHHDYYHYYIRGEKYNSGNWLRVIKENRPNTKIVWVRREDSQMESLGGKFPYSHTTRLMSVLNTKYDMIFICFSPECTPPHLRYKFTQYINDII